MVKLLFSFIVLVVCQSSCSNSKTKQNGEVKESVNLTEQQTVHETNSKYAYVKLLVKDMFKLGDTASLCSDVIEIKNATADTLLQIADGYIAKIQMYASPGSVNIINQNSFVFDTYPNAIEDQNKNCGKR